MTPLESLRALRDQLGSTARLAESIPAKHYGPRQVRRWLAGHAPIPLAVQTWLASQDYVAISENLHEKSDTSDSGQKTD